MASNPTLEYQHLQVVLGITGLAQKSGDFLLYSDQLVRLDLPTDFQDKHIAYASRDLELVTALFQQSPDAMKTLLNALIQNKHTEARALAHQIGFTEEQFTAQGGGFLWIAIVVAAAILLYSSDAS